MGWDMDGHTHTRAHMRSDLADAGPASSLLSCFSFLLVVTFFFFSFVCLLLFSPPTARWGPS